MISVIAEGTGFDDTYDGAWNTGPICKAVRVNTGVILAPGQGIFISFQSWYNSPLDTAATDSHRYNFANRTGTVSNRPWGQALLYGANTTTWPLTYNNAQGWQGQLSGPGMHIFGWQINPPDSGAPLVVPPLQVNGPVIDDRFGEISWHWWVLDGFPTADPFTIPSWGTTESSFTNPTPRQVLNYKLTGGPATGSTGSDANPVRDMLAIGSAGGMRTTPNPIDAITTGPPDTISPVTGVGFFDEATTTTILLKNGGGNPFGTPRRIRHSWGTLVTRNVGQPEPFTTLLSADQAAAARQRGLHWGKFTMAQTNLRAAVLGGAFPVAPTQGPYLGLRR